MSGEKRDERGVMYQSSLFKERGKRQENERHITKQVLWRRKEKQWQTRRRREKETEK